MPVTVLVPRDAIAAGPYPLLLYGYGAYSLTMMPHLSDKDMTTQAHRECFCALGAEKGQFL
ncbi:MAG: hypothetical protein ACRYHQ_29795 [Janthinobacterium lividum]